MSGPEFIIALVAIICVTSLIKTWLDKKENTEPDKESFNRLAKAFVEHKKEMQERVQNLETIIAEEEREEGNISQIEASDNESLTNDLHEKERINS